MRLCGVVCGEHVTWLINVPVDGRPIIRGQRLVHILLLNERKAAGAHAAHSKCHSFHLRSRVRWRADSVNHFRSRSSRLLVRIQEGALAAVGAGGNRKAGEQMGAEGISTIR